VRHSGGLNTDEIIPSRCHRSVYSRQNARRSAQPSPLPHSSLPPVTIPGSEVRALTSKETGRNYDLYIHIPSSYPKETTRKYPVLYILDGQWDFKLMDSVLGGLVYDKFVPEIIMVGLTYSGDNPDYNTLRAVDFTPVPRPDPATLPNSCNF
jgi:predicted alpha/beta superfamily hydrolase